MVSASAKHGRRNIKRVFFLAVLSLALACAAQALDVDINLEQANWIADRIFANECSSRESLLLQWNEGEDFLSLGIGHFIWYPKDANGPFVEVFPLFLEYAFSSGADIPQWLKKLNGIQPHCPWRTREEFMRSGNTARFKELRIFIEETRALQAEFIVRRFKDSLREMVLSIEGRENRARIIRRLERLISTTRGLYAAVDYSIFKGMGISESERYDGNGWGLFQVLLEMNNDETVSDPVLEFAESAEKILIRRVNNSPKDRDEIRWLKGWLNRVRSYTW
ncbi:MAG: hypothetical protein PHV77_04885 [Candidatus Omnitrophica bacterium]|jgi:hypothetical protein|nr:hypothetical protein [Candidatus Omnitrophota bacterium]